MSFVTRAPGVDPFPITGSLPLTEQTGSFPERAHDSDASWYQTGRVKGAKALALAHIKQIYLNAVFGGPPPMISFQYSSEGAREYVVTSWPRFWKYYCTCAPQQRTFYEMIRGGLPCKLHLDLEQQIASEEKAKQLDAQIKRFIGWLGDRVKQCWPAVDIKDWLWLDSSDLSQFKYSVHLTLELSQNSMFADPAQLRAFMHWVYAYAVQHPNADCWWPDQPPDDPRHFLADLAIYANNDREWRLLYATKRVDPPKKPRYLRCMGQPNDPRYFNPMIEALFYRALVSYLPRGTACKRLLTCSYDQSINWAGGIIEQPRLSSSSESRYAFSGDDDQLLINFWIEAIQSCVPFVGDLEPFTLHHGCLVMRDRSRYCALVGRAHASNNVYYVCWLRAGRFYQRCLDPDCFLTQRATYIASSTAPTSKWAKGTTFYISAIEHFQFLDTYCDAHGITDEDDVIYAALDNENKIQSGIIEDLTERIDSI